MSVGVRGVAIGVLATGGVVALAATLAPGMLGLEPPKEFGTRQAIAILLGMAAVAGAMILAHARPRAALAARVRRRLARSQPLPPRRVLVVATWLGVVAGLSETLTWVVQGEVLGFTMRGGPHTLWMCPLGNVVFTAAVGGVLCLVARWLPALITMRSTVAVVLFAWLWSVLHLAEWLHRLTQVLLALGVALAIARFAGARPVEFGRLARRTLPWLAALVPLFAAGVYAGEAYAERRAMGALPPAPAGAPNVLFLVLDTVRSKSLSLYGYHRPTSARLERLAERSVVFDAALATAPWTLPSHGSMFTGRYPHELSTGWEDALDGTHRTLAEVFAAHGYVTGGFVGNLRYCSREYGLGRGFARYRDYTVDPATIAISSAVGYNTVRATFRLAAKVRNAAPDVNRWFFDWVGDNEGRPFFAFLNYFDAHAPYLAPGEWATLFGEPTAALRRGLWRRWSDEDMRVLIDAYDAGVAYVDHQVGVLLDEMERRGLLDNTLVVIVGDHGEHLGEHGLADHGNSLYRPVLHVPLLLSFPRRVPSGRRVEAPVTLRDLPATVLDLAGLVEPAFPGYSLARHWSDSESVGGTSPLLAELGSGLNTPEWFPVSNGDMRSVIRDGMHWIRNGDGREELYAFDTDPQEQHDLIHTEEGARVAEQLRAAVTSLLEKDGFGR